MTGPSDQVFRGERYAVVGLGRNGLPVAHALRDGGADVSVWDDKLSTGAFPTLPRPFDLRGFDALVLSPGIPHVLPAPHPAASSARAAGIPILSDAELLYRRTRRLGSAARFAGVTGTNGKSTTTALLHHILVAAGRPAAAGGNLGTPALALPPLGDDGVYALEMSSYMLERLDTLRFDAACLLNVSPDHLDRHGSLAGYTDAKLHVFDRQRPGDAAILGIDDPNCISVGDALAFPATRISGSRPADLWCDGTVLRDAAGPILRMADAPALPGAHNAQNAAAAAAMALALGVPRDAVAAGIRTFPGLDHRQRLVATVDGVPWINDSKATNADAAARALACYRRAVWIAGGVAKEGGIEPLRPLLGRVAHALLIGRDGPGFAATLRDAGIPHTVCTTLDAACDAAARLAPALAADAVLLSPACASFDQFPGFEARGDRFAALAHTIREPA